MNNRQTLLLVSFDATETLLKQTNDTAEIAGLPARLTLLSARLVEIREWATLQLNISGPKTAHRAEALNEMSDAALNLAAAVATHAAAQKNTELSRIVELAPGSFRRLRQTHRPWLAQRILDAATGVLPQLAPLGVTEATLAELRGKIDRAQGALAQPRVTIAARRKATTQLTELFAETEALLRDEIDQLIFPLRLTNPAFYAEYLSARRVPRATSPDDEAEFPPSTNVMAAVATPPPAAGQPTEAKAAA